MWVRVGGAALSMDSCHAFHSAISHEDPWYVARCLEVELTSQAGSFDDALVNLREALEWYFEDERLPESVEAPIIVPVDILA